MGKEEVVEELEEEEVGSEEKEEYIVQLNNTVTKYSIVY